MTETIGRGYAPFLNSHQVGVIQSLPEPEGILYEQHIGKALQSLFYFGHEIIGNKLLTPGVHGELAKWIDGPYWCPVCKCELPCFLIDPSGGIKKLDDGRLKPIDCPRCKYEIPRRKQLKLVLIPRDCLKSTFLTQIRTLHKLCRNPNERIFIGSEKHPLSRNFLANIKDMITKNERFRDFFGEMSGGLFKYTWNEEMINVATRSDFKAKEKSIETGGIDVTTTGRHFQRINLDDLHSEDNSRTKEQIDKVIEYIMVMMPLLEADTGGELLVVGTRWGFGDAYQFLIDLKDEDGAFGPAGEPLFDVFIKGAYKEDGSPYYPVRNDVHSLQIKKAVMSDFLFSCNPGYAPIWMADGTFKWIEAVKVGEEVVGFECNDGKRIRIVPSKVKAVNSRFAETVKITLESGRTIICTPDHEWYTGRFSEGRHMYAPAKMPDVAGGKGKGTSRLFHVIDPVLAINLAMGREYRYLAGMIDGEGACKHGSIQISQSRKHNPYVCDEIERVLDYLQIPYYISQSDVERKESLMYILNGGRQTKAAIIHHGRPAKAEQIMNTIWKRCGRLADFRDRVASIEPHRTEEVFSLETETGNYIVWGYASKNCQFLNDPVPPGSEFFDIEQVKKVRREDVPPNLFKIMLCDPASLDEREKMSTNRDNTALVTVGIAPGVNELGLRRLFLLDLQYGDWALQEAITAVFGMFMRNMPYFFGIEKQGMSMFGTQLTGRVQSKGGYIKIHDLKPKNRAKLGRIERLQPYVNTGMFHVVDDIDQADSFLKDIMRRYPRCKILDPLDALAYTEDVIEEHHRIIDASGKRCGRNSQREIPAAVCSDTGW